MIFYHEQWPSLWAISIANTKILASKNLSYNWVALKKDEHFQKRGIFQYYLFRTHKISFLILKTDLEPLGLYRHKGINAFYMVFVCKYYERYSLSPLINTGYAQFFILSCFLYFIIFQFFFFFLFGKQAQPTILQLINIRIYNYWYLQIYC